MFSLPQIGGGTNGRGSILTFPAGSLWPRCPPVCVVDAASSVSVPPPQGATLVWEWTSGACGAKQDSDYDRWIRRSA